MQAGRQPAASPRQSLLAIYLLLTSELYNKLLGLHYWFKHTYGEHNIFRIGYDQQGGLYIPSGHFPVM